MCRRIYADGKYILLLKIEGLDFFYKSQAVLRQTDDCLRTNNYLSVIKQRSVQKPNEEVYVFTVVDRTPGAYFWRDSGFSRAVFRVARSPDFYGQTRHQHPSLKT